MKIPSPQRIAQKLVEGFKHARAQRWLKSNIRYRGQAASNEIARLVASSRPAMICRYGTGELKALVDYGLVKRGRRPYRDQDYQGLEKIAGFFPLNELMIARFHERMIRDTAEIDILGSWIDEEYYLRYPLRTATRVPLRVLEPYFNEQPWTKALRGKTVLVVHPFASTIASQYARRAELFKNPDVLPDFTLKTLRAVQSIGHIHGRTQFPDWFAALAWMEEQMAATEFDVALIGCGAYGFPLAAHAKRLGRKAVHLGGATQLLFGIRGNRWDNWAEFVPLYNDAWIYPSEADRPDNFKEIEGGSYW